MNYLINHMRVMISFFVVGLYPLSLLGGLCGSKVTTVICPTKTHQRADRPHQVIVSARSQSNSRQDSTVNVPVSAHERALADRAHIAWNTRHVQEHRDNEDMYDDMSNVVTREISEEEEEQKKLDELRVQLRAFRGMFTKPEHILSTPSHEINFNNEGHYEQHR